MSTGLPIDIKLLSNRELKPCSDPSLEEDCWIWTGNKDRDGYGRLWYNKKTWRVHRLAYFLVRGPLIKRLEIDHLCGVRACFNPNHLEMTTHAINSARGNSGRLEIEKTACKHGHKFTEDNTRWRFRNGKLQQRECITCTKKQRRQRYLRDKMNKT